MKDAAHFFHATMQLLPATTEAQAIGILEFSGASTSASEVNASFSVRKETNFPMSEQQYLISMSILVR